MMGGLIECLNLEDGQLMTYLMISITSLSSSNPKTFPPHRMCDIGNSIKAVFSPSALFIKDSVDYRKRVIAFDGYRILKYRSKLESVGPEALHLSFEMTNL